MALQTTSPPSVQVDVSVLSQPDSNGVMTSVTTTEGINKMILSLDFKKYKAEIKTADAQNSHKEGVTMLVTGCSTEDSEALLEKYPVNIVKDSHMVPFFSERETVCVPDPPAADLIISHMGEDQIVSDFVHEPSDHERLFLDEKKAVLVSQSHAVEDEVSAMVESAPSSAQEDTPKKSYASIVKVAKSSSGHNKLYAPTNTAKVTHKKTENQSLRSAGPASHSETSTPISITFTESNNAHDEAESCSIYVRNLPINITATELEVEFKKFGPVKQGGIQVRHNKASPITIGGQEAVVEKKKSTRVDSGSRHCFERERFRDDFRGRGNYGGGWAYPRNEYGNWDEFASQGRGSTGQGDGYQRGRGRGRGGCSGGLKQQAVIA